MTNAQAIGDRMVFVDGVTSSLMKGDPDAHEYGDSAIPKLFEEGWEIVTTIPTGKAGVRHLVMRKKSRIAQLMSETAAFVTPKGKPARKPR